MGLNFYVHIKAKYNYSESFRYKDFDDDPKVQELTNGYEWNFTYYKDIETLNKDYYHVLHIGKSSAGWHFSLCIYPLLGINNLDDWKKIWSSGDCKIYTEEGEEISEEELMSYIVNRQNFSRRDETEELEYNNEMAKKEGTGRYFSTYDQLLRHNGATRGKNGLWAHGDSRYTLTDDTYDLTSEVNFS